MSSPVSTGAPNAARPPFIRDLWLAARSAIPSFSRHQARPAGIKRHLSQAMGAPLRRPRLFCCDMLLCLGTFVFAALCRFGFREIIAPSDHLVSTILAAPIFAAVCALVLPLAGLYGRDWRYASISDLLTIGRAVAIASLVFVALMFVITRLAMIPRTVIVIEAFVLTAALALVRLRFRLAERPAPRTIPAATAARSSALPVLLVGAGDSTDLFLRALQRNPAPLYQPLGILDTSPQDHGLLFRGVPILGGLDQFDAVVRRFDQVGARPRHVVFTEAVARFGDEASQALIARAEVLGIAVSRLAPQAELRTGHGSNATELRQIELSDLLERPQAVLDRPLMQRFIRNRRVLITGAGGSIGSELAKQIAALDPAELIVIDNSEYNLYAIDLELSESATRVNRASHLCDIRDKAHVEYIFERYRPEIVFHAAALKHVPLVELNPREGILTNVLGTRNVADATKRVGALAMVQISTDKVVNPTSFMGATKRLGELYCQSLDLDSERQGRPVRFMTVRFGNVLGSSGSLIPLFKRQLARGGPLTVTHPDMTRYFMTIREAVELTLHASAHGLENRTGRGEIFVLDMGEPIRIMDVARRMIRLAGFTPDADIKIDVIGCRPGEKLFEELFDSSEQRIDLPIPGVFGAVPTPLALPKLVHAFDRLQAKAATTQLSELRAIVRDLLPTYQGALHRESDGERRPREDLSSRLEVELAETARPACQA